MGVSLGCFSFIATATTVKKKLKEYKLSGTRYMHQLNMVALTLKRLMVVVATELTFLALNHIIHQISVLIT